MSQCLLWHVDHYDPFSVSFEWHMYLVFFVLLFLMSKTRHTKMLMILLMFPLFYWCLPDSLSCCFVSSSIMMLILFMILSAKFCVASKYQEPWCVILSLIFRDTQWNLPGFPVLLILWCSLRHTNDYVTSVVLFLSFKNKKYTKQHPIAVSQSKKPICFISQPSTTFLHTQLAFYWDTSSRMTSKSRRYVDLGQPSKQKQSITELSFLRTVDETCHLILSCSHFPFSTNDTFKSRERYCCTMKTLCSFF